jgi:uncharacterized protein involved in outer membrane biogenesis
LYDIKGLAGRVGDSDVGGTVSVETKGARPLLTADLRSRKLDFDDLASVFGGAPDPTETAIPSRSAPRRVSSPPVGSFPTRPCRVRSRPRHGRRLVKYRALSILAPGLPLKDVALTVDLKNGLLKIKDLALDFRKAVLPERLRSTRGRRPRWSTWTFASPGWRCSSF